MRYAMRIRFNSTRLDMELIDAYRIEPGAIEPLVRVFMSSGACVTLIPKYEGVSLEEIVEKLDNAFFVEDL